MAKWFTQIDAAQTQVRFSLLNDLGVVVDRCRANDTPADLQATFDELVRHQPEGTYTWEIERGAYTGTQFVPRSQFN